MFTSSILPINNNNIKNNDNINNNNINNNDNNNNNDSNNNDNNNNNDSNSNNDNNNNDDTKSSNQKIISTSSILKFIEVSSYLAGLIVMIVLLHSSFDYKLSPVSTAANSTQLLGIYLYMYITINMIIILIEFIKTHIVYLIPASVGKTCKIANGHYQPRGNNSIINYTNHHNLLI